MDHMHFYAFLFILWLLTYLFFRSVLSRRPPNGCRTANLPPSPTALPLLGHLHLLGPLVHQSFDALAKRYGPIVHLRLGSLGDTVLVCSPALAKEFLKSHDLAFASRPWLVAQHYIGGEDSITFTFLPYGPRWRFFKKVLITELLSAKRLEKMTGIRQEEIKLFLRSLLEKSTAGESADLEEMLPGLTNNIICRMMMGMKSLGGRKVAKEYGKLVEEHVELSGKLNIVHMLVGRIVKLDFFGYGKRLKKANKRFMEIVEKIIEEHEEKKRLKQEHKTKEVEEDGEDGKEEEEEEDLLDILLKIAEDEAAECKLTRHNIRTFLLVCFFVLHHLDISAGGTETSAITMQWALAELLKHPITFKKAREEIDSVVGTNRLVKESDIPNLPYIQAVLKETLRLHPPAPINLRSCDQDCSVAGFSIPKGTNLFINVWSLGRDPEHWEDPLEFRPERFLNSNIDVKGQHFQLVPFGSGRRMCPGMPLALSVMQVTIASVVQCFDWRAPNGEINSIKTELREKAGITIHMAQPLGCIPVARCLPFTNPL
ncbi:hypothetical protein ACLOJK_020327 [Asimina triloba]